MIPLEDSCGQHARQAAGKETEAQTMGAQQSLGLVRVSPTLGGSPSPALVSPVYLLLTAKALSTLPSFLLITLELDQPLKITPSMF